MQYSKIKTILAETSLPVTYYSWPEKQAPALPYLVWYLPNSDNVAADNKVYKKVDALNVELYTKTKDFAKEAVVEAILDKYNLVWNKTESYLDSEQMYEVLYEMEIVVNG